MPIVALAESATAAGRKWPAALEAAVAGLAMVPVRRSL